MNFCLRFYFPILLLILIVIPSPVPAQTGPSDQGLIDMVIVLDRSGSMKFTDPQGLSIPAACFILEQLALSNDRNRATVVPFNNQAHILGQKGMETKGVLSNNFPGLVEMLEASIKDGPVEFRENSPDQPVKFHNLLRTQMRETGYTELGMALSLARDILEQEKTDRRKIIVLISDGSPEPNINNRRRLKALSSVVGNDLVQRIRQRNRKSDIARLNNIFAEHLLKTTVSSLGEKNISVYPVAFLKEETGHDKLIQYLADIKELTVGDREIISATAATLVEKLIDFVPSSPEHVQLYTFKGNKRFVRSVDKRASKEISLVIPDIASQLRFFFSYPDARKEHKVGIELFKDGVKVADNQERQQSDVIFSSLRRRDGSLAYQSFRFVRPSNVPGKWRIRLRDNSAGKAEHLPDTDLLVDIRAQMELSIAVNTPSRELNIQEPVEFRFKLLGKKGAKEYLLPISQVDAFVIGRSPKEISRFTQRLRDIDYEDAVAIANWKDGFSQSGIYKLRGHLLFDTVPRTRKLATEFEKVLRVYPGPPVNAWFGKRGTSPAVAHPDPDLQFNLPPLGENFMVEFTGAEIETDIHRVVNTLSIRIDPFRHQKTGAELDRDWIKIIPDKIKGLSANRFIPIKLKVQLPDAISSDIPDGVYETVLYLKNGVTELASVPLFLTLSIPRFVHDRKKINTPYLGPDQEGPFTVEHTILYPGRTPHTVSFPVWSTSIPGVKAKSYFDIKEALTFHDLDDKTFDYGYGQARNDQVIYETPQKSFDIPGKNSANPGKIKVQVTLSDPSLNGKSFENILEIVGNHHRSQTVRIITHIKFIPTWLIRAVAVLGLLAGACLFWLWLSLHRNHDLFEGYIYNGDNPERRIRFGKDILGTFSYNNKENSLSFVTGSAAEVSWQHGDEDPDNLPTLLEGGAFSPESLDRIYIRHNRTGRSFTIEINEVPNEDNWGYGYEVIESDLGTGSRQYAYIIPAILLGAGSIFLSIQPYIFFQWIR